MIGTLQFDSGDVVDHITLKNQLRVISNILISTRLVFLSWVIRLELKKEDYLRTRIVRVK